MSGTNGPPSARGPLIILAELGKGDFAWLDALRRRHYPPDHNRVEAHLTLFRSLPPSAESEIRRSLAAAASSQAPEAEVAGLMDLDSGVAFRIRSPQLEMVRGELAEQFRGLLSAQDMGRWTPHVTIQNKVRPSVSRALLSELRAGFGPSALTIAGLRLVRYADGDWEELGTWRFR